VADDFGAVFGARVRELREAAGATQDQLARAIGRTGAGIHWTRARVAQVETGNGIPDLAAMHAVALALQQLGGSRLCLADLLPETGTSELVALWREALTGAPVRGPRIGSVSDPRLSPGWGQVEDRVADQFPPGAESIILTAARNLYGRTGSQERDHRAGPGASQQRKGHASRLIIAELLEATRRDIGDAAAHDAALEADTDG
jgi:transcriptional regulator with XRE-family HTH domain